MNSLDRFMEYVVAVAFLYVGFSKIIDSRPEPKPPDAVNIRFPFALPHWAIVAIGLVEILAALALITPLSPWPQATVVRVVALGLAFVAAGGFVYHMGRRERVGPAVVLFLLAIFLIVGSAV